MKFELAPLAPAYVNPTYGMQLTGASTGMSGFHDIFQHTGTSARAMLIAAAAAEWKVDPERCTTSNGYVLVPGTVKRLSYGELAKAAASLPAPKPAAAKSSRVEMITKPRLDIPSKVNGSAIYAIDVKLPHMLYAAVAMSPVFGGTIKSYDGKGGDVRKRRTKRHATFQRHCSRRRRLVDSAKRASRATTTMGHHGV
ncbi:hypothetical protein AWV79_30440 [Cupriavidus sp. UYMMa02A]|nr:hypothetical protein AWV79_30440 [Cupriavidus sp. UYMMa02A]